MVNPALERLLRRAPMTRGRLATDRPLTLDESYELCRSINRRHATTYYWSTLLLPAVKRHHVHALYAFARHADDIVDELPPRRGREVSVVERAEALWLFGERFFADLERGRSDDPVLKAVVHTVRAFGIDPDAFRRFLRSMGMDLTIESYGTFDDLLGYMDGSAAAIGEMMLPILEPIDVVAAAPHARQLGNALQLTNFLRDIGEDLDRGRQYLPQEDLHRFGVDLSDRRVTPEFIDLMRFEIARCRALYSSAGVGVNMLPMRSARGIRAAQRSYERILWEIEGSGYDVFNRRARVPALTKLAIGVRCLNG